MTVVWIWLAVSIVGALVSAWLSRESLLDLGALPIRTNGRRTAAISRLTRESLRLSVHAAYILAGLAALDILPWLRPFIVWTLMYGNIVLVANSLIDARTRRLLFAMREETVIEREDREVGDTRRAKQARNHTGSDAP